MYNIILCNIYIYTYVLYMLIKINVVTIFIVFSIVLHYIHVLGIEGWFFQNDSSIMWGTQCGAPTSLAKLVQH